MNDGVKGKAIPLQAWRGPEGSRKLKFLDFMTAMEGGEVVSRTHRPHLSPENSPGTHFCRSLSRTDDHRAIGNNMSMKNYIETIWNQTSDLPNCSTAERWCGEQEYCKWEFTAIQSL